MGTPPARRAPEPGPSRTLHEGGQVRKDVAKYLLDGEEVIPGFRCPVREIFPGAAFGGA